MVHTVGLLGASGNVGAPTLKLLIQSASVGKIKLVVLHRPGRLPSLDEHDEENIELRVFNPDDDLGAALRGINVFVSTVAFTALEAETALVNALAQSPDIITFFPSSYTTTWTEEDEKHGMLGQLLTMASDKVRLARQKGVGITTVYTGLFDDWFFKGFLGASVQTNTIWANEKQLENRVPITTIEHLAQALHRLATSEPHSIRNTENSVVSYWPTGNELQALFSKINGKPAEVKPFTAEDNAQLEADMAGGGPVRAGYRHHWEMNSWRHDTKDKAYDNDYDISIEQTARKYA